MFQIFAQSMRIIANAKVERTHQLRTIIESNLRREELRHLAWSPITRICYSRAIPHSQKPIIWLLFFHFCNTCTLQNSERLHHILITIKLFCISSLQRYSTDLTKNSLWSRMGHSGCTLANLGTPYFWPCWTHRYLSYNLLKCSSIFWRLITSPSQNAYPGSLSLVRAALIAQNNSAEVTEVMLASLQESTLTTYASTFKKWWFFCSEHDLHDVSVFTLLRGDVLQFFLHEFHASLSLFFSRERVSRMIRPSVVFSVELPIYALLYQNMRQRGTHKLFWFIFDPNLLLRSFCWLSSLKNWSRYSP